MKIGTIYYIVNVLSSIEHFLIVFCFLSFIIGIFWGMLCCFFADEKEISLVKSFRVNNFNCYLKSLFLTFFAVLFIILVPSKKDMLIIITANAVDEKILQNEDVSKYVTNKLKLIDKKIDSFLEENE